MTTERQLPASAAGIDESPARSRLARAAAFEIARNGLQRTEVRYLSRVAGTSTSQFYRFFHCRDDLLVEVFEEGWQVIQHKVGERLLELPQDIPDLFVSIANALIDAVEEEREIVSATLIIGFQTMGQRVRKRLKDTEGFKSYRKLGTTIAARLQEQIPEERVFPLLELLFGGISRQLLLLTPLYKGKSESRRFNREPLLAVLRGMINGVLADAANTIPKGGHVHAQRKGK